MGLTVEFTEQEAVFIYGTFDRIPAEGAETKRVVAGIQDKLTQAHAAAADVVQSEHDPEPPTEE